jgi:PAS domain S-box-containing protein
MMSAWVARLASGRSTTRSASGGAGWQIAADPVAWQLTLAEILGGDDYSGSGDAEMKDRTLEGLIAMQTRDKLLLLLAGQSRVLELIAEGAPLASVLDELMRVLEQQVDGMLGSVLLLSEDRKRLRHIAAPSLPDAYNRAVDGGAIGPFAGSCGTAAYRGQQVIVADIATDPLWVDWKDVALESGLHACWSTPILSKHGEVLGTFAMYYRQTGTPSPLHLHLIGVATHLAGIAIERDETDRERRRLLHQLATVIDQLPAGVVVADGTGQLILGNRQLEVLFGQPFLASVNLDEYRSWQVFHADGTLYDPGDLPLARSLVRGETCPGEELLIVRHDDSRVFISAASAPIRDLEGRITGAVGAFWDISERKHAEQERERLVGELEVAVRSRDDFLSTASHELRTPLTTLMLQSSLLLNLVREPVTDLPQLELKALSNRKQLKRLDRLISDLLDVGRLNAGKLPLYLEELDLAEVVREVLERFGEEIAQVNGSVTVESSGPTQGKWDRMRIEQVVSNLISNALKYGGGQPVRIFVEGEAERARVRVRDAGIGIDLEQQERIFQRFERAVSGRNFGGLGLGLWISRQLVEELGGTIYVESQLGSGATFTVELPREPQAGRGAL